MYTCADWLYLRYEAPPEEEQNFATLVDFINAIGSPREMRRIFKNPVDLMFDELERRKTRTILRYGSTKNTSWLQVIYALSDFLIMILSWLVKQSLRAFLFQEVQP